MELLRRAFRLLFDDVAIKRWRERWKGYLAASILTGITLLSTLLLLGLQQQVVVASLGATAFVVLAMPKSRAARTAATIGGQSLGLLAGGLAALVPHPTTFSMALVNALAVALCSLAMLATRYKHPPAAGTALGVSVTGIDLAVTLTVVGSTLIISAIRILTLNLVPDFSADD